MKPGHYLQLVLLTLLSAFMLMSRNDSNKDWIIQKHNSYNLLFETSDKENTAEYAKFIDKGMISATIFFSASYPKKFDIYIHPSRRSLDSTWQKDWNMPAFRSECWMVASGVATKLDMISPKLWPKESCEHDDKDSLKTQELITHELIHVYHGQFNASPDFSSMEGLDWFVEGLATYASGLYDSARIAEVKKAISENNIPKSLDSFWTGKLKYGLSGSVVKYIDERYGRMKLKQILSYNKKSDLFTALKTTDAELLDAWKKYMQK
jgi:hypothetical protein